MRTLSVCSVSVLALALAGCATSGASSAEAGRDCLTVPAEAMSSIAEGANDRPITPIAAAAVRSEAREDMTVIAMSFTDPGEPDVVNVGAWGLGGGLDKEFFTGPWVAIDAFAQTWTVFPSEVNGESFSVTEDGVSEAQACLAALGD